MCAHKACALWNLRLQSGQLLPAKMLTMLLLLVLRLEELGVRIPGELLLLEELQVEELLLVIDASVTIPPERTPDIRRFSVSACKIARSIFRLVIPEEQAPLSRWCSMAEGDMKRLLHSLWDIHFTLSINGW